MGIKGLSKLLQEMTSGNGIKSNEIKSYFGRKIAIDASMALYQFLIAVRQASGDGTFQQLTNEDGQVTSHLIGMLYRTIRMMENGIKPVYVFDGKPPDFKSHELEKRKEAREKAKQELKEAEKADDAAKIAQMERRLVKVDKTHVLEAQRLLTCLGVPWIAAPGEAEAQCAILVQKGLVFGTATEDMDALTFGTPILLRQLTYSEARKMPVLEFNLNKLLKDLSITMDQFIDICILCGCDYIPSIRGIGPKKALQFIKEYGNIEKLLLNIDTNRYKIPNNFLYKEARLLFKKPNVENNENELNIKLKWNDCNKQMLIDFLVKEKGFSLDRIESAYKRILKCKGKATQRRVDSFFSFKCVTTSTTKQIKLDEIKKEKEKKLKQSTKKNKNKNKNKNKTKTTKSAKKNNKTKTKTGPYANIDLSGKKKPKAKTAKKSTKTKSKTKKSTKKINKIQSKTQTKTNNNDTKEKEKETTVQDKDKDKDKEKENTSEMKTSITMESTNDTTKENSNSSNNDSNTTSSNNNDNNEKKIVKTLSGKKRKHMDSMEDELEDFDIGMENDKKSEESCNDNNNNNNNKNSNDSMPDINSVSLVEKENNSKLNNCNIDNDNDEKEKEKENGDNKTSLSSTMKSKNIKRKLNENNDNNSDSDSEKLEGFDDDITKGQDFDIDIDDNDKINNKLSMKHTMDEKCDNSDPLASPPRKRQRLNNTAN